MNKRKYMCLVLLISFLLGSYNGYIALWKGSDPEPIKVFPYKVSSLPPADRSRLECGISIDSIQDLEQMLEDYLS